MAPAKLKTILAALATLHEGYFSQQSEISKLEVAFEKHSRELVPEFKAVAQEFEELAFLTHALRETQATQGEGWEQLRDMMKITYEIVEEEMERLSKEPAEQAELDGLVDGMGGLGI